MHLSEGFRRVVVPLMLVMALGSLVVLRRRPKSMIDLWLHVAVWSFLFEALLNHVSPGRFSLVFYVNRGMGIVSSAFVLLVLLSESSMLHRRLVATMAAREQEREGHRTAMDVMVGSLAHELRQPLAAILMNGQAGDLLLSQRPRTSMKRGPRSATSARVPGEPTRSSTPSERCSRIRPMIESRSR